MSEFRVEQKHTYATPHDVWQQVEQNTESRPGYMLELCEHVADLIDGYCRRHFVLITESRFYDRAHVGGRGTTLQFDADLQSLTSLKVGRVTVVTWTDGTEFFLYPLNQTRKVWVKTEPGFSLLQASEVNKVIEVEGLWGYVDRQIAIGTVETAGIDDSATVLPVTPAAGVNVNDLDGALLDLEAERMYVTRATANDLTVERGVLGTTAAAHAAAVTINRKLPPADIRQAAVKLAVRSFRQGQSGMADAIGMQVSGELVFAQALPADVKQALNSYRRTMFA